MILVHAFSPIINGSRLKKHVIAKRGDISNYQPFASKKALELHREQLKKKYNSDTVDFYYQFYIKSFLLLIIILISFS